MQSYLFLLECIDGGYGWGETGQRAQMTAKGSTIKEAKEYIKRHIPGGWKFKLMGKTRETFFLKHLKR